MQMNVSNCHNNELFGKDLLDSEAKDVFHVVNLSVKKAGVVMFVL